MTRKTILKIIKLYQKTISLDHGLLGKIFPSKRHCKFTPTCSQYSYDAIEKYGILKGGSLGLKRIARCNPWAEPGQYDPVS
ncbi:membrane protein insertion efficiency factor YidD [bacterium]|nr:membrane protein insertion efficiency factor YidD [bacterium]